MKQILFSLLLGCALVAGAGCSSGGSKSGSCTCPHTGASACKCGHCGGSSAVCDCPK